MRRIAPLFAAGALAVLGPIAAASAQTPAPGQAGTTPPAPPRSLAPAAGQATATAPAPPATYDPAVQRAAAQAPASAPSPGQAPAPLASTPAPAQAPAAAPAPAQAGAPAQVQAQAADPELDAILGRWEAKSGQINTLYAAFDQVDQMTIVGETKTYKGKAYLLRPNNVVLQLEKQEVGEEGKETFSFDRRIVANSGEVIEFDGAARQINIYPMPKDAQQRALEEGPLPFLFRMNIAAFKQRYRASLVPSNQEGTYRIAIWPKLAADRDAFSAAVLILDAQTLQPRSIHTLSPNGKDRQNYTITELRANVKIEPTMFALNAEQLQKLQQEGWRVVRNPEPQPEQIGREAVEQPQLEPIQR